MPFNSAIFMLFCSFVLFLYHFACRRANSRIWLIVVASIAYYATCDLAFTPILLFTALLDYFLAKSISQSSSRGKRRSLLAVSIACNLGVLCFFKYTNFLLSSASELFATLGATWNFEHLD